MKKWLLLSLVLGISASSLFSAGDLYLGVKAGANQRSGIYKENYGSGRFAFGGIVGYEVLRFYRSNLLLEFDFNFEDDSEQIILEHIGGAYTFDRSLRRAGYALRLRYEYNFSKDGISFAAGVQRDFEKETLDGQERKLGFWRPTISATYEMNLSGGGKTRIFFGADFKFNVDGGVEAGLVAGLKMKLNLFRKYED